MISPPDLRLALSNAGMTWLPPRRYQANDFFATLRPTCGLPGIGVSEAQDPIFPLMLARDF